jgi:hypothetical protein
MGILIAWEDRLSELLPDYRKIQDTAMFLRDTGKTPDCLSGSKTKVSIQVADKERHLL